MRKIIMVCLLVALVMSGCSSTAKSDDKESIKNYENYIDADIANRGIDSKSIPFDYKLNVYKMKDHSYQYELAISNPRSAMYHIQAIAVDPTIDSNTNVHPCLGLLGEDAKKSFNMIPYQANPEKGFYRGFSLEGISNKSQFTLYVMVTWKDSALVKNYRVFFTVSFVQEAGDNANGKKQTADTANK